MRSAVPDQPPYRNAEDVVISAIEDLFSGPSHVDSQTPSDLQQRMPFARVRRVGGFDRDPFTDAARVVVDVFAATYAAGTQFSEQVRQRLRAAPEPIDRTTTVTAPVELPWDDPVVRRWSGTYLIDLRRP